jgi:hypothetical protein
MALRVPPQFLAHVQSFLELSDERIQEFSDALAKAGSRFNTNDLAVDVSKRTNVPRRIAEGVVQVLAALYTAREDQGIPLGTFLDEQVAPAVKTAFLTQANKDKDKADTHTAEEVETRWTKLRKFLVVALMLDDTVGTAAKAGPVMTEHERIFDDARILTDVRLIFHPDLSEKPNAGVIVHMLRGIARLSVESTGSRVIHFTKLSSF